MLDRDGVDLIPGTRVAMMDLNSFNDRILMVVTVLDTPPDWRYSVKAQVESIPDESCQGLFLVGEVVQPSCRQLSTAALRLLEDSDG